MEKILKYVEEFHEKFEQPFPIVGREDYAFHAQQMLEAIAEEYKEFEVEIAEVLPEDFMSLNSAFGLKNGKVYHNLSESTVKELADLTYVVAGAWVKLGLADKFGPIMKELHKSNMSKLWDGKVVKNEKGKVLKPASYRRADMSKYV